jgi:hypothetical protein
MASIPACQFSSKKKAGKKGKRGAAEEDEDEEPARGRGQDTAGESFDIDLESIEAKMDACVKRLQKEFSQLRTGRANPGK